MWNSPICPIHHCLAVNQEELLLQFTAELYTRLAPVLLTLNCSDPHVLPEKQSVTELKLPKGKETIENNFVNSKVSKSCIVLS